MKRNLVKYMLVHYEVVKDTLSNFHKLLEITAPEDKKTLLQLIISKITIRNKKDIESIELHFDEKVQKYFINNNEGESPDDGGSPLFILFTIKIQLLLVLLKKAAQIKKHILNKNTHNFACSIN